MIRPTFLGFETAKRALAISQLGLDIVGHNINNASTPGYTRQRVDQVSIASSGYKTKYQTFGVQFPGQGADVNGINQIRDKFLDNRYRTEATKYGELSIKYNGLEDINKILDEISTDGLHAKLSDLLGVLDILSQQADSPERATVVRNTVNEVAAILNRNSHDLDVARAEQLFDLNVAISDNVNNIIRQIADLNVKIKEDNFYNNPSNELNDSRNLLLDQLSEYLDIKIIRTPVQITSDLTIERVSVELNNSGTPPIVLIDSGKFTLLESRVNETTGKVSIAVVDGMSEFPIIEDITPTLLKGGIKGYLDILNGEGPLVVSGNTYRGIPYYKAALDDFASEFARILNTINSISQDEAAAYGGLVSAQLDKNLLVPLTLETTYTGTNKSWIGGFKAGTYAFSGKNYNIAFTTDGTIPPTTVTAELEVAPGVMKTFTAQYDPNEDMEFIDEDGTIAFTIANNGEVPEDGSSIVVNAKITAANISISQNWIKNPLYLTATKLPPVNRTTTVSGLPTWLSSMVISDPAAASSNGKYNFTVDATANTISIIINGETYSASLAGVVDGQELELKDATTGTITGFTLTIPKAADVPTTDTTFTTEVKTAETGAANDNILKLIEAFTLDNVYGNGIKGTFQEYLVDLQKDAALDQSMTEMLLATSDKIINDLADQRDSISAVNTDEEAINMMTYQNYYNAAARYMTTLDEALDKIINGMGIVGR